MDPNAFQQFRLCLETLVPLNEETVTALYDRLTPEEKDRITAWYRAFRQDIAGSKAGYPVGEARQTPDLEDQLWAFIEHHNLGDPRSSSPPTLCLSHDIDYLKPTFQMGLKRTISQRRLQFAKPGQHYLDSIEALLAFDVEIAGHSQCSTVFMANRAPVYSPATLGMQWLIDPSYSLKEPLFKQLVTLLERFHCEAGIHGSFFSLEKRLLAQEKGRLEHAVGQTIRVGRQHWLNLPIQDAMERIAESGLTIDSTLGWNGAVGFRCGMARPFPLLLNNRKSLWEMPMVLMDGPMFDDLKLSTPAVVELAISLLDRVYQRNGCVAINWHDRAADVDYGWFDAYRQILTWAKERGFEFRTISTAVSERQRPPIGATHG